MNEPQIRRLAGPREAVATEHPLATSAALRALAEGGSAVDAAIAASAVLGVVAPQHSQLGGDLFALVLDGREPSAVNASGPAPRSATLERYRALGEIPVRGALGVEVPGLAAGWAALHAHWGRLPFARLLEDAAWYAEHGAPVTAGLTAAIRQEAGDLAGDPCCRDTFLPLGHPLEEGDTLRQPALAHTLRALAGDGPLAFYRPPLASAMAAALTARGAEMTADDFADVRATVLPPLHARLDPDTVLLTNPPPSQGFVLAAAARLCWTGGGARLDRGRRDAAAVTALRCAFTDRQRALGDPAFVSWNAQRAVDQALAAHEDHVNRGRPCRAPAAAAVGGDTTCLTVADASGTAVALIQSVFHPFGAAVLDPHTGVLFNDRLAGFSLAAGHPNALAPGKRAAHTLHVWGVAGADGAWRLVGGAPGAQRQPQTNLQLLFALLLERLPPAEALLRPRWSWIGGARLDAEERLEIEVREALEAAGYAIEPAQAWSPPHGRAAVIARTSAGYEVAADPRGEGQAAAR